MKVIDTYLKGLFVNYVLEKEDFYKSKHVNFNYFEDLEKDIKAISGNLNKYRDIEEILRKYSENEYSKRRLVYYMEKNLLPEANKTAQNQAGYSDYHVGMFFFIDQLQEIYKLEEISGLIYKLLRVSKFMDFGKLLEYYGKLLLENYAFIGGIKDLTFEKEDSKCIEEFSKRDLESNLEEERKRVEEIVISSEKRMVDIKDDDKKELLRDIMDIILSIRFFAQAKYNISLFEYFMKR